MKIRSADKTEHAVTRAEIVEGRPEVADKAVNTDKEGE